MVELEASSFAVRTIVIVILPEGGVAVERGGSLFEGGGEVLIEGFGLATRDQFFDGMDEADRKDLQAMLGEQLEVYIKLYLFHSLVQLGHLFDDILVETHEDRV